MVSPIASDVPSPKELVTRARALIPTLIERAPAQQAHRRIQRLPSLMSRSLLLMDRSPRLRARVIETFQRFPIVFQRLLEVHIGHRACIFPGIDELLASGLHLLTS